MNANQTQKHSKQSAKLNLSLVPMEKAEPPTIWQRMKKAFAKSDLNLQGWQELEFKRIKQSSSAQGRNH